MVGIAVRFTAGRFHATHWGHHVNEGTVEWPPSPWRLLRALVAVWRRTLPEVDQSSVEELLSRLASPPSFYLPPARVAHTRHYMPLGTAQGKALVFDTFVTVAPQEPVVALWPDAELDARQTELLARLLDNLPYLGRAESWVRASLLREPLEPNCPPLSEAELSQHPGDVVRVLGPAEPLNLPALVAETGQLRSTGYLLPPGSRWLRYRLPEGALDGVRRKSSRRVTRVHPPPATVVRFVMDGPVLPLLLDTLRVAEVARLAAMSQYGRQNDGTVSATLSGRGSDGSPLRGHRHAFYIPTDEDDDGRLDHLTIWAPAGLTRAELDSLAGIKMLKRSRDGLSVSLIWLGAGAPEDFRVDWMQPHVRWRSRTPFVLSRHMKLRGDTRAGTVPKQLVDGPEAQLRLELRRRSYPTPLSVYAVPGLHLAKAAGARRSSKHYRWNEFHRWRSRIPPAGGAYGFELTFEEPVTGPLLLGYGCHYGLGLFYPAN